MAKITGELIRKCAEHNEGEIFSLEELSLHQRNIAKIEHLDKWCRDLKILYLHSNLISKIENLNRLKKLGYVNFTLNNITRIENLEGCESLQKLDFTVNFIGELTSIENLKDNYHLEELYLTGNPCAEYEGYRDYVIATLPQLIRLDGEKIKKSERILAMQKYNRIRGEILEQQRRYLRKTGVCEEDILKKFEEEESDEENTESHAKEKSFWKQPSSNTPQSRIEIYKHLEKNRKKNDKEEKKPKPPRKLTTDDGRILNVNEAKLSFEFDDDEENNCFKLDLAVYRHLDSSLLDADVQPTYVRVRVKGKFFQLLLPEEVHPDLSIAQRSQSTGHLLITMPKVKAVLKKREENTRSLKKPSCDHASEKERENCKTLEITPSIMDYLDKIVSITDKEKKTHFSETAEQKNETDNIEFIDDPTVPPLI